MLIIWKYYQFFFVGRVRHVCCKVTLLMTRCIYVDVFVQFGRQVYLLAFNLYMPAFHQHHHVRSSSKYGRQGLVFPCHCPYPVSMSNSCTQMIWDLIICIHFARAKASKSIKLILDDLGLDLGLDHLHVFARAKFD